MALGTALFTYFGRGAVMADKGLLIYLCNAVDEDIRAQRQIVTDSPAATNKVFAIAGAIQQAGLRCVILSLGRGRQNGKGSWHPAVFRRSDTSIVLYCSFLHLPLLTHVITAWSLTIAVVRLAWHRQNVILLSYNRAYHYIPALVVARLLQIRSCLDLEDGYLVEGRGGIRHLKNTLTRSLFSWLCPHGSMVANTGLAGQLDRPPAVACHGVASATQMPCQDWNSVRLQVLFSGTLLEEVGCNLLLAAVGILRCEHPDLVHGMHFVVTGKGPCAEAFRSLAQQAPEWLSFSESLGRTAYLEVLNSSHVGLSLRLAEYEMGTTTFPSKVVEYAEHGLLVLTTRASDVPMLFGEEALYLEEESARALAALLSSLPGYRKSLRNTAIRGRERVLSACAPEVVGQGIRRMLVRNGDGK